MNRNYFIGRVKKSVFGGRIGQAQIDGINFLLDAQERWFPQISKYELAYVLATVVHETGRKMWPVKEVGGKAYYTRLYDIKGSRPELARSTGNTKPGDGARYCGRGYPQTTWKDNYAKAGRIVATVLGEKVDFVKDPEKLLQPKYSAVTMYYSMIHGEYTGRKLSNYISSLTQDYEGARHIINGKDKAKLIAGYALAFLDALTQAEEQPAIAQVALASVDAGADATPIALDDRADDDAAVADAAEFEIDDGATGKSLLKSKTAIGSISSGLMGSAAVAKQISDNAQPVIEAANAAKDTAGATWTLASGLGPWVIALVVVVVAVGIVVYERHRHSVEYGV